MKRFRDYAPHQVYLLPPSPQDWLPAGHLVYFLDEVVEHLDLSAIYSDYQESRGQPPYDPAMMVKIWLYAYSRGIRSSRKVERAVQEDIGFRVLAGGHEPKFWALNQFRTRHLDALSELFVQTVRLAQRAGLVKMEHVAADGTKLKANASKHSAMSYSRMQQEEKRLRREIEQYLRECDAVDAQEDEQYGRDRRGDELPEHLRTRKQRLEAIRKAMAELEEEAREKARAEQEARRMEAEAAGKAYHPRKDPAEAQPEARAQRNFTDPESRIMKSSDKSFIQGYNAQVLVDAGNQIVVAADLTNQPADAPHLPALLVQCEANTGRRPEQVSADAGYWSQGNLAVVEAMGAEAFIPPDKVKHSEWRTVQAPKGRIPKNITPADRMRRKLRTKRGRACYVLRQTNAEPVFGQIKEGRQLRQVLHRGLRKVRALWRFDVAVHNLLKMYRARVRFT